MDNGQKYDIFISYRREGGQETAVLFYERLTQLGYRVAYDIESLRSGVFDEQILKIIRTCKDVIVVLGPGALDRCVNPDDWVMSSRLIGVLKQSLTGRRRRRTS